MPKGEPSDWDIVEETMAHQLAREFAYEFIVDEDHACAMQRIGCDEPDDVCMKLGKALHKHPLTTEYIREALKSVCKQVDIDPDNILSMLMREATDKAFGASQRGRIAAMKEVREWWMLLNGVTKGKPHDDTEAGDDPNSGMPTLKVIIQDHAEADKAAAS